MQPPIGISRVILTVLDGLRPDAVAAFGLHHLQRLADRGASSFQGQTVSPSVTAAAMGSLFTGVAPRAHGLMSDRFHIPRPRVQVSPLPRALAEHGYQTSAFLSPMPLTFRPLASRMAKVLGVGAVTFVGRTAPEILLAARATLQQQRCGLILFHWPDADRAGHEHGWMSAAYREAARRLDATLGLLASLTGIVDDPCTVLIALADHGGGGARPREHDSAHAFDTTIPIVIAGGQVSCGELAPCSSLLDVPATVLWALGVPVPATYAGRPLVEAFAGARDDAARPRPDAPRAIAASA